MPAPTPTPLSALVVERFERVLRITLNRPAVFNCVNAAMATELGEAIERFEQDDDLWVAVLTGAGERAFCSGADLKEIGPDGPPRPEAVERWGFGGFVRHPRTKPVIAAVNGLSLGGGTEIALACDLVVAAEDASFGLPEVKRALVPSAGGLLRLQRQIPLKAAMFHALTGEPLPAPQALHWGFVNQLVPRADLDDAAMALARQVAANAPTAVRLARELVYRSLDVPLDHPPEAWALSEEFVSRARATEDYHEGVRAFREKRAPVWRGR